MGLALVKQKNIDYIAVWKQDTTVSLHELSEAPFRLSLVLNFQRREFFLRGLVWFSTG
jgi:hypothetical protein